MIDGFPLRLDEIHLSGANREARVRVEDLYSAISLANIRTEIVAHM
jgi:hypothetical protein